MSDFVHYTKELFEPLLLSKEISDSFILKSNLDNLSSTNILWKNTCFTDTNCNNSFFNNSHFDNCKFFHSSLINSSFSNSNFTNSSYSGVSLIKLTLKNVNLYNHVFDSCTLQRANLSKVIIRNSVLKNFEGVLATLENCVFINSSFEINFGSGMNGFSSAAIKNCIFINCKFYGYPLRGAFLQNSTFSNCTGEISDDFSEENTYGLSFPSVIKKLKLTDRNKAEKLINEVSNA